MKDLKFRYKNPLGEHKIQSVACCVSRKRRASVGLIHQEVVCPVID
jgi:hypothetical protein